MSGGLTPCRQLRPSSRREHVKASKSYGMEKKKKRKTIHLARLLTCFFGEVKELLCWGQDAGIETRHDIRPRHDKVKYIHSIIKLALKSKHESTITKQMRSSKEDERKDM